MVTDESGEIEVNYIYRAFGEQLKRLDSLGADTDDSAKYSYGGKELDDVTNLYYFNARYYDATIGRFINVDPVQDGTNWYVYTSNNPLNAVDPTGLEWVKNEDGTYTANGSEDSLVKLAEVVTGNIQDYDRAFFVDNPYSAIVDPLGSVEKGTIVNVDNMLGFDSVEDAAYAWGKRFGKASVEEYREFHSHLYEFTLKGETRYGYTGPTKGSKYGYYVVPGRKPPQKYTTVGDIHSHGAFLWEDDDSWETHSINFSDGDFKRFKSLYKKADSYENFYLVNFAGELRQYSLQMIKKDEYYEGDIVRKGLFVDPQYKAFKGE